MRKAFTAVSTVILMLSLSISTYAFSDTVREKLKGTVVLYLNSTKAFVNGTEKEVDSSNLKVFPVLSQNNTLIPLRFVSENLNAKVKWDEKTNTAVILLNSNTVKIKTGSTTMLVNGKEAKLGVPAKDIEDRLFIPLRAVVEAFGKKVFWDDRGLIIISDKEKPLDSEEEVTEVVSVGKVLNVREALSKKVLEKVIKLKYDNVSYLGEGLVLVEKDYKYGFLDNNTGKEITDLKYDDASSFYEGLMAVKKDDKWGFIDTTGKEVIELKYDFAEPFYNGLAIIKRDSKFGYIDQTGKEIIEPQFDEAYCFRQDYALVNKDGREFFIDKTGKEVSRTNILGKEEKVMIKLNTDKGDIQIEIYPNLMPVTTENFLDLVNKGFYNDLTFHRVEDWVIQGGDPKGDGTGGSEKTIKLETNAKLKNIRGAVAMARSSDPDSASSQFYILKTDADWLDGKYAVFGNVVSGMDVVDNIALRDKMVKVEEVK